MEESKESLLPWQSIFPFLQLREICMARLVAKDLYTNSKPFFSKEKYSDSLYTTFVQGLLTKKLTNSVLYSALIISEIEVQILAASIRMAVF